MPEEIKLALTCRGHRDAGDELLRDLTDERFAELYDCDRFTATVLSNRLRYAVQHVAAGLLARAFSPIIALCYDFAVSVCAPPSQGYSMVAVTNGLTVFIGTMPDGVRVAVEEYGVDRLVPGDLLMCNDPIRMGNHPNDICFIRPVFRDGEIVGFMVLRAHHVDVGGIVPGGFSGAKRNTYENGLVITPRLLYHAGEPVRETFSLFFDNARLGEIQLPDLKTINACCELGEELLGETVERYGREAYLGALRYACDASAESMRTALERLPDGDYRGQDSVDADAVDADEEYVVDLLLRKRGGRVEADFSGSSRQARTSINAGPTDAKCAVGVGLKMLIDPSSEFTSGTFRNLDLVLPPGTIASALPPDGPIFNYPDVQAVVMGAILRALGKALGEDALGGDYGTTSVHNGYGTRADGSPWVCGAMCGGENGPWGGTKAGDGDGFTCTYLLNIMAPSSESLEHSFPVMILRREYAPDSAGAGFNRGGAAVLRDVMWLDPTDHTTMPLHFRRPSGVGVLGGGEGALGGVWIFGEDGRPTEGAEMLIANGPTDVYRQARPVAGTMDRDSHAPDEDGEFFYYCARDTWSTAPGATWRYLTNGGGGWGDPLRRDPERVMRDVRDGYLSVAAAADQYGVAIVGDPHREPERLRIDRAATEALRGNDPGQTFDLSDQEKQCAQGER